MSKEAVEAHTPTLCQTVTGVADYLEPFSSASDVADFLIDVYDGNTRKTFQYPGGPALGYLVAAGINAVDRNRSASETLERARVAWNGDEDDRVGAIEALVNEMLKD